ncbi:hypothetical protein CANINC_004167 [Pichia inconspicua]|uniref:Uncharacterized protein n=1 Tax=Pichia inconspicua TaxID=52247 RepID=A0A4T0WWW2_9ASCO|nr:hypothetical protein CANINC_004167 [[Candida] inconspicua]
MRGFGLFERRIEVYKEGITGTTATGNCVVARRKEAGVVAAEGLLAEKVRRGEVRPVSSYEAGAARRKRWARWTGDGGSSNSSGTVLSPLQPPPPPIGNDILSVLRQIDESPDTVMRRAVSEVRLPQVVVDACIDACVETGRLIDGAALAEVCAIHGTTVTAAADADAAADAVDARGVVERPSRRAVGRLVRALVRAGDGRRARHVTEAMAMSSGASEVSSN